MLKSVSAVVEKLPAHKIYDGLTEFSNAPTKFGNVFTDFIIVVAKSTELTCHIVYSALTLNIFACV